MHIRRAAQRAAKEEQDEIERRIDEGRDEAALQRMLDAPPGALDPTEEPGQPLPAHLTLGSMLSGIGGDSPMFERMMRYEHRLEMTVHRGLAELRRPAAPTAASASRRSRRRAARAAARTCPAGRSAGPAQSEGGDGCGRGSRRRRAILRM